MDKRGSITAVVLYAVGGAALLISLGTLSAPSVNSYGPGLVGILLSFVLLGLARACQHLSRIRDILEKRS